MKSCESYDFGSNTGQNIQQQQPYNKSKTWVNFGFLSASNLVQLSQNEEHLFGNLIYNKKIQK